MSSYSHATMPHSPELHGNKSKKSLLQSELEEAP